MGVAVVSTIGFLIAVFYGYIIHLKGVINSHEGTIADLQNREKQTEWKNEIDKAKTSVTEAERDYNQSANDFRNKYGSGDGSQPPPGSRL